MWVMIGRILQMKPSTSVASLQRAGRIAGLLAGVVIASGCGQKGPLALPSAPAKAASAPAPT
jgi:hypothetical protein